MTALGASFVDVFAAALRGEPCHVVGLLDEPLLLPVDSWNRPAGGRDLALLDRCVGPTLDIGCGPGRMTEQLTARGHLALGVDIVPEAVARTRQRGCPALERDVFSPLPGEGRWGTALLADGNIGIGGDPVALLRRTTELLTARGRVVADLAPPGIGVMSRVIRLQTSTVRSRPLVWSLVGVDAIAEVASAALLRVAELTDDGNRWLAVLTKDA